MNSMKNNLGNFLRMCCAIIAAFLISFSANAADWHVDDDAPGGIGNSWLTAFNNLQTALNNPFLAAGDTIKVAQGIYKPGILQEVSFNIPLGVILEGGYAGVNEPDPDLRDPALFEMTILSGDIDNNDVNSPALDPSDIVGFNSFHVVTIIDDSAGQPFIFGTEVDGFLITAGNANNPLDNDDQGGGGAFIIDKDPPDFSNDPIRQGPLFRNCIFQGNRADRVGGAIAAVDVGLEVRDCQILNNESDGGTITGDPVNTYTQGGGGISGIAPMIIVNSTLIGNNCRGLNAQAFGGGLSVAGWHTDNTIAVASCFFASNEAQEDPADPGKDGVGGGAAIDASFSDEVHVMNCVFINNKYSRSNK